jgi:DNA-binding transcriptional regulator YdaS (Cro superfamily)
MNAIQKLIEERGLTQTQFGLSVGVNQSMVNQWISGKTPISPEKALEIETIYGICADDLSPRLVELTKKILKRAKKRSRQLLVADHVVRKEPHGGNW